jgi:hypothetical protein
LTARWLDALARWLLEGSALGDEVEVGEGTTVSAGVSVFPNKSIEGGTEVTEDVS